MSVYPRYQGHRDKIVVYCYVHADFSGLWGHGNPQKPICDRSRTGFVVTFSNCTLFSLIKEFIENLVTGGGNLGFVSI